MDFNAIIEGLVALIRHSSLSVVIYACVVCLLTEVVKRLFIPKLKIDLQKKFDPTIIFPFAFGCLCSLFNSLVIENTGISAMFDNLLVDGLTIGATSTVLYRIFASAFGENLKKLKKDDVFNMFYTEIFTYTNAKQKLLDGQIDLKSFIAEIKLVAQKAEDIYSQEISADQKRQKLVMLMGGLVDDGIIYQVIEPIHNAMLRLFENQG